MIRLRLCKVTMLERRVAGIVQAAGKIQARHPAGSCDFLLRNPRRLDDCRIVLHTPDRLLRLRGRGHEQNRQGNPP